MRNSYPEWQIFNSHQTAIMDSFSCIPLRQQHDLSLNTRYFVNFTLKYLHFHWRNVQFGSCVWHWCQVWWIMTTNKWCCDVKKDFVTSNRRPDIMHKLSYTFCVRQHFLAPVGFTEIPVVYGRKLFLVVGWLVVLRLNVPVNNFSVISGRSHCFLGN